MAHFSAMLLCEEIDGLAARIAFARFIESSYAENRRVDAEVPIVWLDGSRDGDKAVMYDRGGWVAWMMLNELGRERMFDGLRAFASRYHGNPDHPVLFDFVEHMRDFADDVESYDDFVDQWYRDVVIPEYVLEDVERRELADGSGWEVTLLLRNAGTGRVEVQVAASAGERFDADSAVSPDYRESRVSVILGADEERKLTISCDFEPERVLVDPDALVLQLNRKKAVHAF